MDPIIAEKCSPEPAGRQHYNNHDNSALPYNNRGDYRYNGGPSYSNGHNMGSQSGHGSRH